MVHLTEQETSTLREALGLSYWNRQNPTKNALWITDKNGATIDQLVNRGFLVEDKIIGQGGWQIYYKATDAGRVAVLDARWPE